MIKSISYWSIQPEPDGGQRPIADAMGEAQRGGFRAIELAIAPTGLLSVETDQATCERYRILAEQHGLVLETVAAGLSWGTSPNDPNESTRRRSIEMHAAALQRAAWLGAKAMLMVPGAVTIPWEPSYGPVRYDRAAEWSREAIKQLSQTADRVGVDL